MHAGGWRAGGRWGDRRRSCATAPATERGGGCRCARSGGRASWNNERRSDGSRMAQSPLDFRWLVIRFATVSSAALVRLIAMTSAPRPWLVGAIALGAFVGMLDATIVAVALGPITQRFALPLAAGQEVIAIYLVVVMATLPTIGRLSDRFGRRRAYVGGFTLFALGSLLAATATSFTLLLVGRMVQAIGGGVLMAGSLALIAEHMPRRRTGRSVAVMVTTQAVAGLVGPPLGGVLVVLGGWQAVFWVGLPLGVVGITLTLMAVPSSAANRDSAVDVPGA